MTLDLATTAVKTAKPLGGKAYGSIGHLPASRLGPGDHNVHEGQARICCEKPRKADRIFVEEKLDGSCMSVANIDGVITPLTRAGYHADDGTYEHQRAFSLYVRTRQMGFAQLLNPAERIVGEWMMMAHGTRYSSSHPRFAPFIAFDIFREGNRILRDEFVERCRNVDIAVPALIHGGSDACSIDLAMSRLGRCGFHGALDPIEGAVWRDGVYLPEVSGQEPIWNWRPLSMSNGGF
jgi:hypothetical protein